jgi:integration host factor subunit alpha
MVKETKTRAHLSEAVYQEVGLSRAESSEYVDDVLSEIAQALLRGEQVKISSFGSFGIRQKRQRIGRNPKTGKEAAITPRKVIVFKASNILKQRMNSSANV